MPKTPANVTSEIGSAMIQKIFEAAKNMREARRDFDEARFHAISDGGSEEWRAEKKDYEVSAASSLPASPSGSVAAGIA
jgi:hypothetical protein